MARGWGAQSRENATERRKYATKDEQVLMAQVGPRNRGITTGTGEQIGEQSAKHHCLFHCKSITCVVHSVDASSTKHKGSENLRALFLA